jgi:hypothetical protein
MAYLGFLQLVQTMVDENPETLLEGLQGVHVLEEVRPEEGYHDVYRLRENLDPGPDPFFRSGDGLGRRVALYYGSFAAIASDDPAFDWRDEA